jgi:hypothetical protein
MSDEKSEQRGEQDGGVNFMFSFATTMDGDLFLFLFFCFSGFTVDMR